MKEVIQTIVHKTFGAEADSIEEIQNKGVVNLVYKIIFSKNKYILRLKKGGEALEIYEKEKWCAKAVSDLGIPTPLYIATGTKDGYSFSFQEFVEGVHGKDVPEEKDRIWATLGEYAKKFNTIPAPQYKEDLDKLDKKLFGDDFFVEKGIFTKDKVLQIKERIDEMKNWNFEPKLCHANLNPTNTVVHPDGTIHIIDWGTARGGFAPQEELSDLYTWNTRKNNIATFIEGYGLKKEEVEEMTQDIQTLVLNRLLNVLHWKINNNENYKELEFVQSVTKNINKIKDFKAKILFSKNI